MYGDELQALIKRVIKYAEDHNIKAELKEERIDTMKLWLKIGSYKIPFADNMELVILGYLLKTRECWDYLIDDYVEAVEELSQKYDKRIRFLFDYAEPFADKGGYQDILYYYITVDDGEPICVGSSYSGIDWVIDRNSPDVTYEMIDEYREKSDTEKIELLLKEKGVL